MADYSVTTEFRGKDGISSSLSRSKAGVKSFSKYSKAEFKSIGTVFKGTFAANMMSRGVTSMLGVARRGIGTVLEEYIEFDTQIGTAAAKFPDTIKRGTKEFKELGAAAREIGATTEHTSAQAAKGLAEYAKAGINASLAMGLLEGTAELATSAEIEFAEAASMSLDALNIFGLKGKTAAETAANLADVNDVLATVVSSAKLDFMDFNETLQYTGPIAKLAGASMRDVAAMTGLAAMSGLRGTKAGTALKNMYIHLAKKTPAASKALEELGVKMVDNKGDIRDALDIVTEFSEATKDMGSAQRLATTEVVFGLRGMGAVAPIMEMNNEEIQKYKENMDDVKDKNKEIADAMRKSLDNKLKTLQSTLIETGFKIIEAFTGEGADGLDSMIESIQKYDVKPIVDGMKDLLDAGKTMFRLVRDNWGLVKNLAKAFVAVKIGIGAVKFAQWGVGLGTAMKGMAGHAKQSGLLGKNIGNINDGINKGGMTKGQWMSGGGATRGGKGGVPKGAKAGVAKGAPAAGGGVGKAGAAMGVLSVAVVGWAVGTAISTKLEGVGMAASGQHAKEQNMLDRFRDRLKGFGRTKAGIDEAKDMIGTLSKMSRNVERNANSWTTPFATMANLFSGAETPLENYLDKQKQITDLYAEMSKQLGFTAEDIRLLGEAAKAGQSLAKVEVTVGGPGAGDVSTTTSTSGPQAPKVDVKKAGEAA